jgi:hypothetical protein
MEIFAHGHTSKFSTSLVGESDNISIQLLNLRMLISVMVLSGISKLLCHYVLCSPLYIYDIFFIEIVYLEQTQRFARFSAKETVRISRK